MSAGRVIVDYSRERKLGDVMDRERLRKQIAFDAARLLSVGRADDPHQARLRASRRLVRGWTPRAGMPTTREVLDATSALAASTALLPTPYAELRTLLAPLAHVRMPPATHPEGDALYHSLQAFEIVRVAVPYDIELMTAALVHEVGRAIDPYEPHAAGLGELVDLTTERTLWLLVELPNELRRLDGELGARATRRLSAHEDAATLTTLAQADRDARVCGNPAPDLDEALAVLIALDDDLCEQDADEPRDWTDAG